MVGLNDGKKVQLKLLLCSVMLLAGVGELGAQESNRLILVPGGALFREEKYEPPVKQYPKHEACERGFYKGPRVERDFYYKDDYIWAVTEEFAKAFCMPDEFIYPDLQGAEAVAFRLIKNPEFSLCSKAEPNGNCRIFYKIYFELFVPGNASLPKKNTATYFNRPVSPIRHLFQLSGQEYDQRRYLQKATQLPGADEIFHLLQVKLLAALNGKIAWRWIDMQNDTYIKNYFAGLDHIVFSSRGQYNEKERWQDKIDYRFYITFDSVEGGGVENRDVIEFPYAISLPRKYVLKIKDYADRVNSGSN